MHRNSTQIFTNKEILQRSASVYNAGIFCFFKVLPTFTLLSSHDLRQDMKKNDHRREGCNCTVHKNVHKVKRIYSLRQSS